MKKRFQHEKNCRVVSQEERDKMKTIWMRLALRKARFEMSLASRHEPGTTNVVLRDGHNGASRCVSCDIALQ